MLIHGANEPKDVPGNNTIHKVKPDGVESTTWINADKRELRRNDPLRFVQVFLTWGMVYGIVVQLIKITPYPIYFMLWVLLLGFTVAAILYAWYRVDRAIFYTAMLGAVSVIVLYLIPPTFLDRLWNPNSMNINGTSNMNVRGYRNY